MRVSWDSCSCGACELWTSSFKQSSASYPLIASDWEWSYDKSCRVRRMCPLKVHRFIRSYFMIHKKVTLSLPSTNCNKKIKSNGTKPHFVFLLLTGLEANFRKWRKRQVRSTVERIRLPPRERFQTKPKGTNFSGPLRSNRLTQTWS